MYEKKKDTWDVPEKVKVKMMRMKNKMEMEMEMKMKMKEMKCGDKCAIVVHNSTETCTLCKERQRATRIRSVISFFGGPKVIL